VETFGFSAHSDREGLVSYLERTAPKNVVLVHGDAAAVEWFGETLPPRLPGSRILNATPGVSIEL
jgi:predicted metal-dependent RNase